MGTTVARGRKSSRISKKPSRFRQATPGRSSSQIFHHAASASVQSASPIATSALPDPNSQASGLDATRDSVAADDTENVLVPDDLEQYVTREPSRSVAEDTDGYGKFVEVVEENVAASRHTRKQLKQLKTQTPSLLSNIVNAEAAREKAAMDLGTMNRFFTGRKGARRAGQRVSPTRGGEMRTISSGSD